MKNHPDDQQKPQPNPQHWEDSFFDAISASRNPLFLLALTLLVLPGAFVGDLDKPLPRVVCVLCLPITLPIALPLAVIAVSWEIAQRIFIK